MPRVTITIPERTPQPYRFDLLREIVTIGRGLDNDIVVGCGSVSGKHSEMRRVKGGYEIVDVGSTNGIKVDGIRRETVVLHSGMTVKLGDVEFGFTLNEEELAELAAESEASAKSADVDKEDSKEDAEEIEISEKPSSKEKEKEKEKEPEPKVEKKAKNDDGPEKLPPVRLDKKKEKEEQEAEQRRQEQRKERERREKEARAEREEKSERRGKRDRSSDDDRDEFAESKAVTIGSGFILFTLIAAAAAFFYGAHTRHEKDTGESLLKGIVNKEDVKSDAPTEVEDKPESGAE